jgi:hypothetical protein
MMIAASRNRIAANAAIMTSRVRGDRGSICQMQAGPIQSPERV